jgi:ubiquitin-conjugating enzyme E2 Q
MDVTTSSSIARAIPHHSIAVPEAQEIRKCVSHGADVVETSGCPSAAAGASSVDDDAVIAAPEPTNEEERASNTNNIVGRPAEIPPESTTTTNKVASSSSSMHQIEPEEEESDEEFEYEYEDDDDVAFSGFLAPASTMHASRNGLSNNTASSSSSTTPARIVEEDTVVAGAASVDPDPPKKKWKEPSRAAVSMSLRAQSETTGGKRRLAQDLFKIMNQDTEEAGFSLAPKSEDSMDKWTIKLFQFDDDSNLYKDMMVLGIAHVELEMKFPDQYPFEPPFVRVVKPRFKRQTGFVMNGALCMELLTNDGWNPINDIESVIVSIRSLLVVGDGRLQAAADLSESRYQALLKAATGKDDGDDQDASSRKRQRLEKDKHSEQIKPVSKEQIGSYSASESAAAYSHLSDYHKKKGWDNSGWWARKG